MKSVYLDGKEYRAFEIPKDLFDKKSSFYESPIRVMKSGDKFLILYPDCFWA